MISVDDCYVTNARFLRFEPSKNKFGHFCDTEGGSSGSPVIDASSGMLLGVHEAGGCETETVAKALTEECVNRALNIDFVAKTLIASGDPTLKSIAQTRM